MDIGGFHSGKLTKGAKLPATGWCALLRLYDQHIAQHLSRLRVVGGHQACNGLPRVAAQDMHGAQIQPGILETHGDGGQRPRPQGNQETGAI